MDYQSGDLILFYGRDWPSRVIELATWGPSHIGMVTTAPKFSERPVIVESTTLCATPCLIQKKPVSGVQAHDVASRRAEYPGRTRVMRLQPHWALSQSDTDFLRDQLLSWIGQPYDLPDAIVSGTRVVKLTDLAPYPDEGSIFCSALCAAVLMRCGRFPIGNAWSYNPASLVRKLRRMGIYHAVDEAPPANDPDPVILPFPGAHLPIAPALRRIFR